MIKNFELDRNGEKLRGILTMPNVEGKVPCFVYNHGFTGSKMESHFMFVKISRILAEKGIASLRFDYIGSGESDGEFKNMTFTKEVQDCGAVLEYAEGLECIDEENINVIGFSMGGAVALTAASNNKKVKNCIAISPACNLLEVFTREIKNEKIFQYINEGIIDFDGNVLGKEAIEDMLKVNVYENVKNIEAKVLLIHGTNDSSVPPFTSMKIKEILGNRAEINWVDGADHCYSSAKFEKQVIGNIEKFVEKIF